VRGVAGGRGGGGRVQGEAKSVKKMNVLNKKYCLSSTIFKMLRNDKNIYK